MNVQPISIPAKRRLAAKPIKKESNPDTESSKEAKQTADSSHCRPKRTFGIPRSTNIPSEKPTHKPLSSKTCKPLKPAVNSEKDTSDRKKFQHVGLQESSLLVATEEGNREGNAVLGNKVETPVSLVKCTVPLSTPYLSAENCSKCRLDRLETSSYWLHQIKLAEAVGKHFVSAAFFHLALECSAEPFLSLQDELKHYVKRHEAITMDVSWGNLCRTYGISNEQPGVDPCSYDKSDAVLVEKKDPKSSIQDDKADSDIHKDGCVDFVYLDNLALDVSDEESDKLADNDCVELSDDISKKGSEAAIQIRNSSEFSHNGAKKHLKDNNPGRKLFGKPSGSHNLIPGGSSLRAKTHASAYSSGRSSNVLNGSQKVVNFSGGESTRRHQAVARVIRASQLRSRGITGEKG